jgi:hypothetical protein
LEEGRLTLHGWAYDIEKGAIDALDGGSNRFVSLAEHPETCATVPMSAHYALPHNHEPASTERNST